jgi:hypothetical protein
MNPQLFQGKPPSETEEIVVREFGFNPCVPVWDRPGARHS